MLTAYKSVVKKDHSLSTFGFGILGRLPLAMNTVGLVFLISSIRNSFALAGLASACYTLAGAFVGPRIGKLADVKGTRKVLIPITLLNAIAITAILTIGVHHTPALLLSAALAGATFPNFGSYTRTRWSRSLTDDRELGAALSLESVLDETAFVVGPALAGFLFAWHGSRSPLIGAMIFLLIAGFGLSLTSTDHEGHVQPEGKHGGLLKIPYVKPLLATLVCIGITFGAQYVVILAVAREGGRAAEGGLWVGLNPIGSTVAGFAFGFIHWKISSAKRLTASLLVMALGTSGLVIFHSYHTIVLWLIIAGVAIAPALISANHRLKELVPIHRLNEAFSLLGASISMGITIGASLSGVLVSHFGGWHGFDFMLGATVLACLVSIIGIRGEKVEN
jgi:MFS family permease